MTSNPVIKHKSKHINSDFHYIRQLVANRSVSLYHVCSDKQLTDMFTKPDAIDKLGSFCKLLVMHLIGNK